MGLAWACREDADCPWRPSAPHPLAWQALPEGLAVRVWLRWLLRGVAFRRRRKWEGADLRPAGPRRGAAARRPAWVVLLRAWAALRRA